MTITPEILLSKEVVNDNNILAAPHNLDAEQLVLGSILTNNESLNQISDFLKAEHFFEPIHQQIYSLVCEFFNKGIIATPITLKNYFDSGEEFKSIGGSTYLGKLAASAIAVVNVNSYAKLIFDLYLKRKLIEFGGNVSTLASDATVTDNAVTQLEKAEGELFNLSSVGTVEGDFKKIDVSLNQTLNTVQNSIQAEGPMGIPTKLTDLDKLLGGMQNSDLIILAGRPSMGKTALSVNIALNACEYFAAKDKDEKKKSSVGFFSLEMSSEQLASRMIAMKSGVNAKKFRAGNIKDDEFKAIVKANKELISLPFFIDDTPALSISAVRTRARRLKRRNNLGLLVVDYLQLITGSTNRDNRVQEISEITQGLKAIAKELNIPVIALSQLSRAVEQREDKRPQLSDLRESGTIEQDSDIVMFIYREQYYVERKKPQEGSKAMEQWQSDMARCLNKTEIMIAKQRHGPIGNVNVRFDPNTTIFSDLEQNNY